jgi:hypothetical protein
VVAKWRADIIAVLHRDPELCMAVGNDLVGLVDVFEDLILPFTENLRWGVNDDYARKESLLNIVSTAVDLHYALRQKFPMYELTFLELSTHGNCDLFDPTLMKDASREYTPKMVTENVADAFLFEDLFRDARNKRAELENVRMRQERKEALEGEEVVRVSQEITMERSREDRVSFFVTPALRKMELDGTVKVLGKVKVFVGI